MNSITQNPEPILSKYNLQIIKSQIITKKTIKHELKIEKFPIIIKPQNKNKTQKQQTIICNNIKETYTKISNLLNQNPNIEIIIEEKINYKKKFQITINQNKITNEPKLTFSNKELTRTIEIDKIIGIETIKLQGLTFDFDFTNKEFNNFKTTVKELYKCYTENNLKELNINKLILTKKNKFIIQNYTIITFA